MFMTPAAMILAHLSVQLAHVRVTRSPQRIILLKSTHDTVTIHVYVSLSSS